MQGSSGRMWLVLRRTFVVGRDISTLGAWQSPRVCVGLFLPQGSRDHSLFLMMGLTMVVGFACWGWAGIAGVSGLGDLA